MMERPERIEVLKTVRIPVLFIIGEYDYAIPLEESLRQCHLPEKSYIHFLKKSGHMGMLEEPEKVNRILDDFLLQPWNWTATDSTNETCFSLLIFFPDDYFVLNGQSHFGGWNVLYTGQPGWQ